MSNPTPAPAPALPPARIIVELADDGTYIIEHYINGQRSRLAVPRGLEAMEIREALIEQRNANVAKRERQAAAAEAKARALHAQVYTRARQDHGTYFANRFIGAPGRKPGNIAEPQDPPCASRASAKTGASRTSAPAPAKINPLDLL